MQDLTAKEEYNQLSALQILRQAREYISKNKKPMCVFMCCSLIIALFAAGFGGVASWGFWPVLVSFYVLESIFFRFYFGKIPYFSSRPLLVSLIPSIKVIFITVAFLLVLSLLPFIPLLVGLPCFEEYANSLKYADGYLEFLQLYMHDMPLVDMVISGILLFVANIKNFNYSTVFPILGDGFINTFIIGIGNIFTIDICHQNTLPVNLQHADIIGSTVHNNQPEIGSNCR